MTTAARTKRRIEYGDFQTPRLLAEEVCRIVGDEFPVPSAVLEPTCGRGSFFRAAVSAFPTVRRALGVEINPDHVDAARVALGEQTDHAGLEIRLGDFFATDWTEVISTLPEPLLVIGNPPWVTNSTLGTLNGANLPKKFNSQGLKGIEALTGKSNFDISEWMLTQLLKSLRGREAFVAMLCKTAVARRVLNFGWENHLVSTAAIRLIDAQKWFDAAVDSCLLLCSTRSWNGELEADVYAELGDRFPASRFGRVEDRMVSDTTAYRETLHLAGAGKRRWRSGVKHDCAKVMELRGDGRSFENGMGEQVDLEDEFVFPLLKGSDLAGNRGHSRDRWVLVTQRKIGDDTRFIRLRAPQTWEYLERHRDPLDQRASSVYRNRPPYSVFGVGDYAFAPHKVAISGLHKRLEFVHVTPRDGRPTMVDDTCAFLPCSDQAEAQFILELLSSEVSQKFYRSRIFWDAKRPVTIDVLNQLSIPKLACEIAPNHPLSLAWTRQESMSGSGQLSLF